MLTFFIPFHQFDLIGFMIICQVFCCCIFLFLNTLFNKNVVGWYFWKNIYVSYLSFAIVFIFCDGMIVMFGNIWCLYAVQLPILFRMISGIYSFLIVVIFPSAVNILYSPKLFFFVLYFLMLTLTSSIPFFSNIFCI